MATGRVIRRPSHLHRLVPGPERRRPIVSVQDGASHALAWLGSALGTRQYNLGVDRFGESGTIDDLYELTGISTESIVNAALIAVFEEEAPPGSPPGGPPGGGGNRCNTSVRLPFCTMECYLRQRIVCRPLQQFHKHNRQLRSGSN